MTLTLNSLWLSRWSKRRGYLLAGLPARNGRYHNYYLFLTFHWIKRTWSSEIWTLDLRVSSCLLTHKTTGALVCRVTYNFDLIGTATNKWPNLTSYQKHASKMLQGSEDYAMKKFYWLGVGWGSITKILCHAPPLANVLKIAAWKIFIWAQFKTSYYIFLSLM